jgi:ribosomal protein L7/L12
MVTKGASKEKEVEFHVLVADVDKSRLDEAAEAFAGAFGLEPSVSQQIVKSTPIVFLASASKGEIKAITPRLIEVSKAGIEFRVTSRGVQKIPKVNWPVRPQFAFGTGLADGGRSANYNFEHNVFVCPCCGETFLFRRVGRPPLGAAKPAAPAVAAAPHPAVAPAAEVSDLTPEPQPAAVQAEAEMPAEPADNLLAESGPLPASEQLLTEEDLAAQQQAQAPAVEEAALPEEPAGAGADVAEEAPPPEPPPAPPPAKKPAAAPKQAPAPAEEADAEAPATDTYNVFLSKITSNDKKEQAAKLISEMKGCAIDEARELAGRLIIPLMKDVAKSDAEAALTKFKAIKVTGRMTVSRKK